MSIRVLSVVALVCTLPLLSAFTGQSAPSKADAQRAPVASEGSKKGSTEHWKNYQVQSIKSAPRGMSSIVVLRPVGAVAGQAINVYVNGEYLGSLRPGAYTQSPVCPGTNRISFAETNVQNQYREKSEAGQAISQNEDTVSFYTIDVQDGVFVATALEEATALQQLSKMPLKQHHTISRVSTRSCALN